MKTILFFGLCIISAVSCHVVRRDVAQTDKVPSFTEVFDIAQKSLKDFENAFLKSVGVENTDQLQEKAVEKGKEVAATFDTWATEIKKETENLKDNSAIKDLRESADKLIEEYKQKNPKTTESIQNYFDTAKNTADDIVNKLKSLAESKDAQNVKDLSKKLLDGAIQTFQSVGKTENAAPSA